MRGLSARLILVVSSSMIESCDAARHQLTVQ